MKTKIRRFDNWIDARNAYADALDAGLSAFGFKEGFAILSRDGKTTTLLVVTEAT